MSPIEPAPVPAWRAWTPGVRVVVRRPLPAGDARRWTDVLGALVAVDDEGVSVPPRHGTVRVPADEIALTKIVPPAPPRRPRAR
ncbi:putative acetyltransferase [Cellulomonas timonensis]|uniref:putative acetyltransferase n=1 Tax=Cellulomonas timonensis TaxID=1689271 RepID=UPI000837A789|nr:hypothetical protein [Cellulomonas timonensis]